MSVFTRWYAYETRINDIFGDYEVSNKELDVYKRQQLIWESQKNLFGSFNKDFHCPGHRSIFFVSNENRTAGKGELVLKMCIRDSSKSDHWSVLYFALLYDLMV